MSKFFPWVPCILMILFSCAESVSVPSAQKECSSEQQRVCYTGPPSTQGVGECKAGHQRCDTTGFWGECQLQREPQLESCVDQLDNNCDGLINEGCCTQWSKLKTLPSPWPAWWVAFNPNGSTLFGAQRGFVIWEISNESSFSLKIQDDGFKGSISLRFSDDGRLLTRTRRDDSVTVFIWDWKQDKIVHTVRLKNPKDDILLNVISPTGEKLGVLDREQTRVYDVKTGQILHEFQTMHAAAVHSGDMKFSPDENLLALTSYYRRKDSSLLDQGILVWDLSKQKLRYKLDYDSLYDSYVMSMNFLPRGKHLVGMSKRRIKLWGLQPQKLLYTLETKQEYLTDLAVNKTGTIMASASSSEIKFWDVATGQYFQTIHHHAQPYNSITSISFHPNGKLMAIGFERSHEVQIWHCIQ